MEQQDRNLLERLARELAKASLNMEKFNIAEYVEAINNPRRYLMINFLGGLSRGLGIAIGFTLLGAMAVYLLQRLVILNLPLIGDIIAEIVRIVNQHQPQ